MTKGFTLLEVLISLAILIVGVVGVFALIQQTISFLPLSEQRLAASYLTQEGIEIVRNLRDTNIVKGNAWNLGLTGCNAGCEADYASTSLVAWTNQYLLDNNNFYGYSSGSQTLYKRKITIDTGTADVLKITVEVSWQEKSRSHSIKASEDVYNWY
ncbi:prepilin-type N-terminal cleavage/methylation domain-containing protein [Patescibacteria group bacterium]|nr:prepilin-type N-terminal cleavage/methylation domain-containing protein [Patescibacteria group bacterium]